MVSSAAIDGDTDSRVKQLFKVWSPFYDNRLAQSFFYRRVHAKLLKKLGNINPDAVLDVGCGTGELFGKTLRKWPDCEHIGLDLSADMLAIGEEKYSEYENVRFIEASAGDIALPDNSVDLITNTVSSHFYLDIDAVFSEFSRVLKPGGTLAMASLTNGLLACVPGPYQKQFSARDIHLRSHQYQKALLTQHGFSNIRRYGLPFNVSLFVASNDS